MCLLHVLMKYKNLKTLSSEIIVQKHRCVDHRVSHICEVKCGHVISIKRFLKCSAVLLSAYTTIIHATPVSSYNPTSSDKLA